MYFLEFKNFFEVSLLPQAFKNVTLGDLMFVKANTRPMSIIIDSPSNIYDLFRYQVLISKKRWRKRFFGFKDSALHDTPLVGERVVASPLLIYTIEDDFLKLILLNFEDDTSVVEIAFSRLEQKEMSLKSKKHIRKLFLRSPKEEGEVYQKNILNVSMVTRLYFGNLCFITDQENAQEIERLLLRQTRQPLQRFLENGRYVFEFSFKENPFFMHLEPLTDYGAG